MGVIDGEGLGQHRQPGLGRRVAAHLARGPQGGDRRHGDDRPAAGAQVRERRPRDQEGAGQVDRHHRRPVLGRQVGDPAGGYHPGVQHQPVQPPELGGGRLDRLRHLPRVAHVADEVERPRLRRDGAQGVRAAPADGHAAARRGQGAGHGGADPAPAAGDQDGLRAGHRVLTPYLPRSGRPAACSRTAWPSAHTWRRSRSRAGRARTRARRWSARSPCRTSRRWRRR